MEPPDRPRKRNLPCVQGEGDGKKKKPRSVGPSEGSIDGARARGKGTSPATPNASGGAAAVGEVPNDATRKRRGELVNDNNQRSSRRRVSRRTLVLVHGYPHQASQVIPFVPPGLLAESTVLHGRVVRCTWSCQHVL
ncbi:hypothetical protein VPH35_121913 [Triticum aestivum]